MPAAPCSTPCSARAQRSCCAAMDAMVPGRADVAGFRAAPGGHVPARMARWRARPGRWPASPSSTTRPQAAVPLPGVPAVPAAVRAPRPAAGDRRSGRAHLARGPALARRAGHRPGLQPADRLLPGAARERRPARSLAGAGRRAHAASAGACPVRRQAPPGPVQRRGPAAGARRARRHPHDPAGERPAHRGGRAGGRPSACGRRGADCSSSRSPATAAAPPTGATS